MTTQSSAYIGPHPEGYLSQSIVYTGPTLMATPQEVS